MKREVLQDKFRGVLLGLACGDALGAQIEFSKRDSHPLQVDFTGGGPHRLQPGQWTDDTSMALILAEHLADDPTVCEESDLAAKWCRWWKHGYMSCTGECFDIGNQTRTSLEHWLNTFERPRHKGGARGNGALMRVAPVALANFERKQDVYLAAHRQSVITHHIDSGHLAGTYAEIVRACLRSGSPAEAMTKLRSFKIVPLRRPRHVVKSTGYDLDTFEAAVWAVQGAKTAEGAIIRAANLGDDADTVGAVAGALAGAVWGADKLPERWVSRVAWAERLTDAADRLFETNEAK